MEIAKLKKEKDEYSSYIQQLIEEALADQKHKLTATFERETEQLKAQMSLEYHDYVEQADALSPLKNLDKTLDVMDDVSLLQSELSKALNDYKNVKKQFDEVIIELDMCIESLETTERQKLDLERENLELKHRIKTMKARFPEGAFSAMSVSEAVTPSTSTSSSGNKGTGELNVNTQTPVINYATNNRGSTRGKLSAPLSPGLMSRISNIANRAASASQQAQNTNTNSTPSKKSSNSTPKLKPSDLLKLADLS